MSRKFLDTDHPMFRPLWVRLLIVGLAGGWAVFEFATGAPLWGLIFAAFAAYGAWAFFVEPRRKGGSGG
jgi:hypothetical protein